MGTGGLQNPDAPHLVVGDTLPNGPIADSGAGDVGSGESGAASGGEGGGMGESLNENKDILFPDSLTKLIDKYNIDIE